MVEYIACQICTNATSSPYIPKTIAAPSRARADQLSFLQGSATSAVGRDMRGCVAADTAGLRAFLSRAEIRVFIKSLMPASGSRLVGHRP